MLLIGLNSCGKIEAFIKQLNKQLIKLGNTSRQLIVGLLKRPVNSS